MTDLQRSGNTTLGQAQVQVTPGDNGVEVTCEATNSPDTAPPSASFTLSVLCECVEKSDVVIFFFSGIWLLVFWGFMKEY